MSQRALPTTCPNCARPLKTSAKGHCIDRRGGNPCGWVTCLCKTIIDRHGNHMPRKAA